MKKDHLESRNSRIMRRMVDAFNTGDLSTVESLVSPNYVDHQGIGGSKIHGPKGFADMVESFRQARPHLNVTIEELTANGDYVEAKLFWSEPNPMPSSDLQHPYEKRTIELIRVADNQAIEHWGQRID